MLMVGRYSGVVQVLLISVVSLCVLVMVMMVGIFCILKVRFFGDFMKMVWVFGWISVVILLFMVGL